MGRFILSLFLSLLIFHSQFASASGSVFMPPQPAPLFGPWFEGWYIRVVDSSNHLSFATITTTGTHEKKFLMSEPYPPGYKAFVFAPKNPREAFSVEEFPKQTQLIRPGLVPRKELWKASGGSELTLSGLDLRMNESSYRIEISFGQHTPWNPQNVNWGPAGVAGFLPMLPLQWFVVSTKTEVTYRITKPDGTKIQGQGFAHIEKNWGKTFPQAWMWIQGISKNGEHQLAIAGGPLKLGPSTLTTFLVGVRGPDLSVDINPAQGPQVKYETWSDPCNGRFRIRAKNLRYKVEVLASAPRETFVPLAIPTSQGYLKNLAQESFYSTVRVKVWDFGKLIYKHEHSASALEFGADYICPLN